MSLPGTKKHKHAAPATTTAPHLLDLYPTVLLFVLASAVFASALRNNFVGYDDPDYVTSNPHVQQGLTASTIHWAFTSSQAANWHPVTWLSHAVDMQIFGLRAWGHHLTSVLLHSLNAGLLFCLLRSLFAQQRWAVFLIALLFAVHPLRVESVAWVSERKDVLSMTFWLLTLWYYLRRTKVILDHGDLVSQRKLYVSSLLAFALGLMAKPMLVTLPIVMVLLDFWPLGRLTRTGMWPALKEKIPFLLLSAAVCIITVAVQGAGGAMENAQPLFGRLANAVISYWSYIGKTFWPVHLSPFYPPVPVWPGWLVATACAGLVIVSLLVLWQQAKRPWLITGWWWYLVTMLPVSGIVHAGDQAMADRYTYIPSIGLFIMACGALQEALLKINALGLPVRLAWGLAWLLPAVCSVLTVHQIGYWHDTRTLFAHALAVTSHNYVAHNNLGVVEDQEGDLVEAERQFRKCTAERPTYAEGYKNLGAVLAKQGRTNDALAEFQRSVQVNPTYAEGFEALGVALTAEQRTDEAVTALRRALELAPARCIAHFNLALAYLAARNASGAVTEFEAALACDPSMSEAHNSLGVLLMNQGNNQAAAQHFEEAIRLKPDYARAYYNLGIAKANEQAIPESIAAFQEALRIQPDYPSARKNLEALLNLNRSNPARP